MVTVWQVWRGCGGAVVVVVEADVLWGSLWVGERLRCEQNRIAQILLGAVQLCFCPNYLSY